MHVRSASDSLVLMHETSHSMPDLAEDGESTSPEGSQVEHLRKRSTSMSTDPPSIPTHVHGHTRHLSLTISQGEGKRFRKRRSTKRDGSLKLRSRSPPNQPPPPPPPDGSVPDSSSQDASPQHHHTVGLSSTDGPTDGDSEFMNTISDIDQQLEQMANSDSPPMVSVPQQSLTSSDHVAYKQIGSSPVPEYPEEEEHGEFILPAPQLDEMGELREYTMSDIDELERESPEGAQITHEIPPPFEFDTEDSDDIEVARKDISHDEFVENRITDRISFRESSPSTDGLAAEDEKFQNMDLKPAKPPKPSKQHRVMFKEEVEDIPPHYDPTYDPEFEASLERYEPRVDEEIPSTVAELKKMLFGEQATVATRYSTEGALSPRYTHPVNVSFDTDYEFHRDSSLSPNNNNNNSMEQSGDIGPKPRAIKLKEEEKKMEEDSHLYETPWDQKPISKYSVVGMGKRTGSGGQKDRISPHKERIQFAEVSTHEEPMPGNTELRNVHSLERPAKHHRHSPKADPEGSLLESISNTLQGRSNYGSDTLLNSVSPEEQPKSQQLYYSPQVNRKVPRSARGELEKIKAQHRREQKPAKRIGFTSMNGQPRLAASWDELQQHPSTHVTYDANTQTHILRSLV